MVLGTFIIPVVLRNKTKQTKKDSDNLQADGGSWLVEVQTLAEFPGHSAPMEQNGLLIMLLAMLTLS